jgi:hypothetical protein
MCCVSENDLVIDRHRDEDQTGKCSRAATHHHKKVIPLLRHKNNFPPAKIEKPAIIAGFKLAFAMFVNNTGSDA